MSGWGLLGAAMAGIGEGADKAIANQHKVDEANALKEQRIQEIREQGNIHNQQINLQADLNDRNAVRNDARGLIAKGQDNAAALDLYQGKKAIDLKAEADPAVIKAKTDLYNAQHPYEAGEFALKVADTQSKIDERIQSAANETESKAWGKLKYQHEAAAKELEGYNKAVNEGTIPGGEAERHQFNLGRDAAQKKYNDLDAKINGMTGETEPDNKPMAIRSKVLGTETKTATGNDQEAKPLSRAELEKRYLKLVSANKPYLKTLSDEEIIKAIQTAEADQALAKSQKEGRDQIAQKEQAQKSDDGLLKSYANRPVTTKSKFFGTGEGYL